MGSHIGKLDLYSLALDSYEQVSIRQLLLRRKFALPQDHLHWQSIIPDSSHAE
ncbi:hypothetical protein PIL02S_03538 [Paenibacillus illinoisensis]|uniref:Uncharacterized protein n=1 Tax=Paenibacillus illinoisensis TaxID=59845 RepID=A0A2W0CE49_9BACL|nr:hypothetical protein PIL02S_03538 [Paenibacillus illinoisensis]